METSDRATMIESSFCLLSGVGTTTERRLWRNGIVTWQNFLSSASIEGIGRTRKALYDASVREAQEHRAQEDARYFGVRLRPRDQWRLHEWLRARSVYLDIETDSFGQITVIGLYGQGRFTALVRGESLERRRLHDELAQYDLLVTFCGTSFDLPMLLRHFPDLPLDQPHIDLCFLGRQLGFRGGLKAIEAQLGVARSPGLEGLTGRDAIHLWNRWRHSRDDHARTRLLEYNKADCVNLEPLADHFYCQLTRQCQEIWG